MRLLHFKNGELSLTDDMYNDGVIPPYAILSHRWGDEEVSFEEMTNGRGKTKAGYDKILFCAQQAAADGLQHCWVDSCCINKSNSAELTEAINSMFRWYQNAERCYVYLADVSGSSHDRSWESAFRKSKWFTRGWTLQELIAPSNVVFYSKEKEYLGNKQSLEGQLHETTRLPIPALRNQPLSNFSMEERFSWAALRQTGLEEDMAYCLLGIFEINMPLLYGEGKIKAMARLRKMAEHAIEGPSGALLQQKLSGLRQWLEVPDPSAIPSKAIKARVQNTDHWILKNTAYNNWKNDPASVLWLWGKPGSGKTVVSTTVLEDVLQRCDRSLGGVCAHFYFNYKDNHEEGPELMLRSLIGQLSKYCVQMPGCFDWLFALRERMGPRPLHEFVEVLQELILEFPQVFILIEGLDECLQRPELLSVLLPIITRQSPNLHLLMISRHDMEFQDFLESFSNKENTARLEIGPHHQDIRQYIRHRLSSESRFRKWAGDAELRQEIEDHLVEKTDGQ
ncbi:uncharacterized protein N0V89_005218 [Didymosphaeria variabile]|uniref:HET-domain-containing protein n=1 Tax=Didymosphaeria variabile TaxID=1932322 RepID=A0A9W8XLT4_9PLEO|nr:uncharacterized protein N0V89_005218 [Didymosphaeria variabile]KAJ4353488.1 hypothetical protein N0V89_005218 [Didymosphaeria variabile]